MRKGRLLPGVLDVRHPTWDQHEVVGAFAYHLIGDVNVATPSILRLRLHAESLYGYAPGLRETHRELCPGKGVAERGPRIERSYERRAKHHAATAACWLSTLAIFRHPSILRNLICPLATRLNSRISAASSSAASLAFSRGGETPRGAAPSCSSSVTSSTALCGSGRTRSSSPPSPRLVTEPGSAWPTCARRPCRQCGLRQHWPRKRCDGSRIGFPPARASAPFAKDCEAYGRSKRCAAARGHTNPTARRSPPFPSMIASTGAAFPRRE